MKVAEFKNALKDDEVKAFFADIISDKVESEFAKGIALLKDELMSELVKKVDVLAVSIDTLKIEIQRKDAAIASLRDEYLKLNQSVKNLTEKVEFQDSYSRRENLVFNGLSVRMTDALAATPPDPLAGTSDSVADQVVKFCTTVLHCPIKPDDISIAHTLKKRRTASNSSTLPIFVRFVRRSVRDNVYEARRNLKGFKTAEGNKVYINEDLTEKGHSIMKILRDKVRNKLIASVWTRSCKIYAKVKFNEGQAVCVNSVDEANNLR
jgi:hypothetical protein